MYRPVFLYVLRILCCLLLSSVLPVVTAIAGEAPVKSANDARQYETIELANHLRVLLVSDPEADKAAASLVVHAGSLDDPDDRPGLAHFLEHMLFLGTKKYPSANAYKDFINRHGGRENAYTAAEYTNYHFDVAPAALAEALDRFAQFFIAPVFDAAYVDRERKAVEAEYRLKIQDDSRRLHQVVKATSNPRHPFARFSVGSLETLADRPGQSVRDAMLRFYEDHYSANLMTLAVIGREEPAALRRMVEQAFSAVPDRRLSHAAVSEPMFRPDQRPAEITVVPIKQLRMLRLDFTFPWRDSDYLAKPALVFAHLLGHEGQGSLLAWLKSRGWANALSAGQGQLLGRDAGFSVTVELTEAGLAHREEIVAQIFATIRLIGEQGLVDWVIDELRTINDLDFRFQEKRRALPDVISLASNLQHFDDRDVLRGPYAIDGLTTARLRQLLAHLQPGQARLLIMAPGLASDRQEPWYGTPYRLQVLDEERLQAWRQARLDEAIHLPGANEFLPEHLAVKPAVASSGRPSLIDEAAGYELWHEQDRTFAVPRASLFLSLTTADRLTSLRASVLNRLYVDLVNDALNSYAYPASLAGLGYSLTSAAGRIAIYVGGYDDKLPLLFERIVTTLEGLEVSGERYQVIKERLRRAWANERHDRPYQQLGRRLLTLLTYQRWPVEQRLQMLQTLSADDLKAYLAQFWRHLRLRLLLHGNLTAAEAKALGRPLQTRWLQRAKVALPLPRRVVKLPAGREYLFRMPLDHEDSAVAFYLQAAGDGIQEQAGIALLNQLVRTPFFNQLRTEQQLGYIVNASPLPLDRVPGEVFIVQSPRFSALTLSERIETFLKDFGDRLAAMPAAEFERQRQALLTRLQEKDTRLSQRSHRYAGDLRLGYLGFDHRQRLIEAVQGQDKARLGDFFRHLISPQQGRRLLLHGLGQQADQDQAGRFRLRPGRVVIGDIELFRQLQDSYQVPLPAKQP